MVTEVTDVSGEYATVHRAQVRFAGDGAERHEAFRILPIHAEALEVGTEVEVVVDPDQPDRRMLDPASFPEVEQTWRARLALSRVGTLVEQNYFMTLVCSLSLVAGIGILVEAITSA